ncbi:amidase [Amycolatopsis taiwanensis]|uniref:amidase n=1 Tax=Amycolatopsis taiwanensis TaxID=342230 RepID=UPI002555B26B|nr:amidase [Amycolatopsis taiwanensis]
MSADKEVIVTAHNTNPAAPAATSAELTGMDALELSAAIKNRVVSCREVMRAFLSQISLLNQHVNAIVALRDEGELLAEADEYDRLLHRGEYRGVMHGFPHAVKDLADAAGFATTKGSPLLVNNFPSQDSLFVQRIRDAGAIIIGKTNTPEFGLGSQTYNQVFGTTRNAYDSAWCAGGSSGGAAVALALRMLPVADGTDFMGSLRNPAAFNNVIGFRPSFGRVPEPGYVAAPSVAGPMSRTVTDAAMLLSVMSGPDSSAPLAIEQDASVFAGNLAEDHRGTRIAWVGDFDGHLATEPGLLELCRKSFDVFEDLGCIVEDALPSMPVHKAWETFLIWRHWLVSGALYPFYADPVTRKQLKPEVIWEVEGGLRLSGHDVYRASEQRNQWYASVQALLKTYDFILAPSAQVFPFDADLPWPRTINGRPMDTYHRWMETVAPWSLANLPVLNLPVGFDERGRPMGVQLIGRNHADLDVLRLGHAYDQATQWARRRAPRLISR